MLHVVLDCREPEALAEFWRFKRRVMRETAVAKIPGTG
jgi:hypothetical protein